LKALCFTPEIIIESRGGHYDRNKNLLYIRYSALTIKGHLQRTRDGSGKHYLVYTRNGKARYITVAPFVLETLQKVKSEQDRWKSEATDIWEDDLGLVFTNEFGHPLSSQTAYLNYKRIVTDLG